MKYIISRAAFPPNKYVTWDVIDIDGVWIHSVEKKKHAELIAHYFNERGNVIHGRELLLKAITYAHIISGDFITQPISEIGII